MVNGITNQAAQSIAAANTDTIFKDKSKSKTTAYSEEAAVYEKSNTSSKSSNADTIKKMKAEADERTEQLRQLVEKMMMKQGDATSVTDSMWKKLSSGGFIADDEAVSKAQEDVSENGYWGATTTSDRILSFATALADSDPEKMKKMVEAFDKGYEQAAKKWGGELPELCQNTYKMVHDKFDSWFKDNPS